MKKVSISSRPQKAPENFMELEPRVIISEGDLWLTWHGSGIPTEIACGECENTENNLIIYQNRGHSYPNGNSWEDEELVCGHCGKFTLINRFTEG